MNARLDGVSLARLKLAREQVGLQIERQKLEKRKMEVVKVSELVADGRAVRLQLLARLDALEGDLSRAFAGQQGRAGSALQDEWHTHAVLSEAAHRHLSAAADALATYDSAHHKAAAGGLRPRRHLSVSEWADSKRVLKTGTANPGPWRTSYVPYLREVMDSLSAHSPVETVVFMKSAQTAGTECGLNWIGYVMEHAPAEMLHVMPSLDLRKRFHVRRFMRLLTESDSLSKLFGGDPKRSSGNAEDLTVFPGGTLIKAGANSPNSLRSDAVRYVFCDEIDGFQWDVGGEGDPLELIKNRQRTYARRKLLLVSTPTNAATSRIATEYERSDKRRYHVPCPECGALQPLEFGGKDVNHGLKWRTAPPPAGQIEDATSIKQVTSAWYVCRDKGCIIHEHHKADMLAAGRWIAAHPERKVRGYHINALYSPIGMGERWAGIAQQWLNAQGDDSKLKAFINTYLGEVWREDGQQTDPVGLMARLEAYDYASLLHDESPVIATFSGTDVQKDRLEVTIIGIGLNEEVWVLDHLIIPGDTAQPEVWRDYSAALEPYGLHRGAIDTGYNTSMVYAYCESHARQLPIKGVPGPHRPFVENKKERARRLRGQRRRGIQVHLVGTDQAKTLLYSRLALQKPGPNFIHFPNEPAFDHEYFAQLAAEKLVKRMKGGRPYLEWIQTRPRNEALDCLVYALAAYYLADVDLHDLRQRQIGARNTQPKPPRARAPQGFGSDEWSL